MIQVTDELLIATLTKSSWAKRVMPLLKETGNAEFADHIDALLQLFVTEAPTNDCRLDEIIDCTNTLRTIYVILGPLHAALGGNLPTVTSDLFTHEMLGDRVVRLGDDPDQYFLIFGRKNLRWYELIRSNLSLLNNLDKLVVMWVAKCFLDALETDFLKPRHDSAVIEKTLHDLEDGSKK